MRKCMEVFRYEALFYHFAGAVWPVHYSGRSFQSGKSAGLSGAIGGVADSFLAKNKAKTIDAKLARATKWIGALFLVLTLILLIIG